MQRKRNAKGEFKKKHGNLKNMNVNEEQISQSQQNYGSDNRYGGFRRCQL